MTTEPATGQNQENRRWGRSRDSLSTFIWALIFIWAGGVLLAENLGYLGSLQTRLSDVRGSWGYFATTSWPIIFLGAAALLLVEVVLRLVVPAWRRAITGRAIVAIIFLGVGLGPLTNWGLIWPAILIVLGLSLLGRSFFRNR